MEFGYDENIRVRALELAVEYRKQLVADTDVVGLASRFADFINNEGKHEVAVIRSALETPLVPSQGTT